MAKDSAARIELGRSFHQEGTVNFILGIIYICPAFILIFI